MTNYNKEETKIFVIGFNKVGTTSHDALFKNLGFRILILANRKIQI